MMARMPVMGAVMTLTISARPLMMVAKTVMMAVMTVIVIDDYNLLLRVIMSPVVLFSFVPLLPSIFLRQYLAPPRV